MESFDVRFFFNKWHQRTPWESDFVTICQDKDAIKGVHIDNDAQVNHIRGKSLVGCAIDGKDESLLM